MPERADSSPRWILRRAYKAVLANALSGVGVHRVVSALRRREAGGARVLIVSYHRVTHDFASSARDALPSLLISARTLRRQIEHLARTHDIVSLSDAARILASPPGSGGGDVAVVTFDDGYADNHDVALPILASLRAPAVVYVATGYVGTSRRLPHDRIHAGLSELWRRGVPPERAGLEPAVQHLLGACAEVGPAATLDRLIARLPHRQLAAVADALEARTGTTQEQLPAGTLVLSWEQIRALDAAGVEIGGHSVNHAVLANLPLSEARREITGCRDALAERLGRPPRHFAYPNGYHTRAVRQAVAEAGFETGATTEDRENVRGGDLLALRRKVLWENSTLGPLGWSGALATCQLTGVFHALRMARAVPGERPDALADGTARDADGEVDRGRERAAS